MLFAFWIASKVGGLPKLGIFFYYSLYNKIFIPTLSMLAGETLVALIDHGKGVRLYGMDPFHMTIVTFSFLSFIHSRYGPFFFERVL